MSILRMIAAKLFLQNNQEATDDVQNKLFKPLSKN